MSLFNIRSEKVKINMNSFTQVMPTLYYEIVVQFAKLKEKKEKGVTITVSLAQQNRFDSSQARQEEVYGCETLSVLWFTLHCIQVTYANISSSVVVHLIDINLTRLK